MVYLNINFEVSTWRWCADGKFGTGVLVIYDYCIICDHLRLLTADVSKSRWGIVG